MREHEFVAASAAVGGLVGAAVGTMLPIGPAFTGAVGVMFALLLTTNQRRRAAYGPQQ